MDPDASTPLFQEDGSKVDNAFSKSMGFVTTYFRAVESARENAIINDPFAEPMTQKYQLQVKKFMRALASQRQVNSHPEDFIAFRTRYLDDALTHCNPQILQIAILGAGLDARAYRLESLRGCHVLEVDQAGDMFDHKSAVLKELNAPLIAQKVDYIVSDLAEAGLENCLMKHGFNPVVPTFWTMEGLLPYIERPNIVELLKIVDQLSAPGSELWADMPGQFVADTEEWGRRAMKYGEDDPLHGVLNEIGWTLRVQASLGEVGEHFGRHWTSMLSPKTKQEVPFHIITGKKPVTV